MKQAPGEDDDGSLPPAGTAVPPRSPGAWLRLWFLEGPSLGAIVRDAYLTFDRRTLGFTRVLFGFLLITDLLRRTPDWMAMLSNEGVLPAAVSLAYPSAATSFSIVHAFTTRPELVVLWIVMLATYACVLVGYKTKLAQVLTVVWVSGLDARLLPIENGGHIVFNLLALWTAFLPMGDRFSVDAWLASMRRRRETTARELNDREALIPEEKRGPHVTLLGLVLCVQVAAIYLFNVVHKWGPGWHGDGSAVYSVLYVDRMVTPIAAEVRDHLPFWLTRAMTRFVMGAEAVIPFCVLSPLARRWARPSAMVLVWILHIGFGTVFVLGPFAWSLCVMMTLFFAEEDWDAARLAMRRAHRARTVLFDPTSSGALFVARCLARLDAFELFTFKEAPALPTGIAVRGRGPDPRSARQGGAEGWARIIDALPLGPLVSWTFRAPFTGPFLDLVIRVCQTGLVALFFGIEHASSRPSEGDPSRVKRSLRRARSALREAAIFVMFAAAVNQGLVELWSTRRRWYDFVAEVNEGEWLKSRGIRMSPQPEVFRVLTLKLRFLQGWFMFAPNPIMDDGTIVVDAITVDGRHVDPFTGEAPDFDLSNAKSLGYNQIWSDYMNRAQTPQFAMYRRAMRDYLLRLPERTGRAEDAIVSGDVYWVRDMNPLFEDPRRKSFGYARMKLFTFDAEHLHHIAPAGLPDEGPD